MSDLDPDPLADEAIPPGPGRVWYRLATLRTRPVVAYGLAVVTIAVSLVLTAVIDALEPTTEFHAINVLAAIVAAVLWGRGPGVFVAIVGTVAIDFFFGHPRGQVLDTLPSAVRVIVYGAVASIAAVAVAALRNALHVVDAYRQASQRTDRIRRNVIAVVTHDLRSPMAGIDLHAAVLDRIADAGAPPEKVRATAATIRAGVEQMRAVVSDLQDAVQIELGAFRVEPRLRDPAAVARRAVALMQPLAQGAGVALELEADDDLPAVQSDRIEQALVNLIGNAVKFTERGGRVLVTVRRRGPDVTLDVADDGPGIPAEELPRVFERYWTGAQLGAARGTGLGLFITQGIVRSNGGSVSVTSEVGAGSTFTIRLPVPAGATRDGRQVDVGDAW